MEGFILARNPDEGSSLPYLVSLPIEGGIFFKTRETWPRASRSYCHPIDSWPEQAEVIEEVGVKVCRRRGAAIDLILNRRTNYRSQFVFTRSRGREVVLWQTAKVARQARPGLESPDGGLRAWRTARSTSIRVSVTHIVSPSAKLRPSAERCPWATTQSWTTRTW